MQRFAFTVVLAAGCSGPAAPVDAEVAPTELPALLSQTGLYADFDAQTITGAARAYVPQSVLWSDAADKQRWIVLPANATIDTTDFDRWVFPVGTKWFKEFSLGGKRLETRVIWRVADTGDREQDTLLGSYVWNDSETEAIFARDGAMNVRGTQHDVPAAATCWKCHVGEPGRALGFSAIQLGDTSSLPLSTPAAVGTTFAAPNAALGYLHANCGHCHNPQGSAWASSSMVLRLHATDADAASTELVQTTVDAPLQQWINHGYTQRIVPGDPDMSALLFRMGERTVTVQMPPIATEQPDAAGVTLIRDWIQSL